MWPKPAWLALLAIALLSVSVILSAWTVLPRLWGEYQKGVVFWGSIARYNSAEVFTAAVEGLNDAEKSRALAREIYLLSRICKLKFRLLRVSMVFGILGGIGAATAVLWIHLSQAAKTAIP